MKLTKKLEAEVMDVYEAYWGGLFNVDMEIYTAVLDNDFKLIGTTEIEVFFKKVEAVRFLKETADQVAGNIELRNRIIKMEPVDKLIIITEQSDVYVNIDTVWTFYSKTRVSSLLKKNDNDWKLIQMHISHPDSKTEAGETIGLEKISKENLELREAIKRRTVELESKNRELEIETSLERVRAVAMGMKQPNDTLDICKVMFTELQLLGFADLRNTLINFWDDENESLIDYDYSDYAGGNKAKLAYSSHPVFEQFQKKIKKSKDAFAKLVVKKEELESWKQRRRQSGEYEDPRLNNIPALYYFFYSIGTGSVGISTFSALTEEKIDLLKRFRNVFDFAYRRYMDVAQAEAQTREAQIEAAVERVRTQSMAMQQTGDIAKVNKELYQQLTKLKIEDFTGVAIYLVDDEEMVTVWDLSSPGSMGNLNSYAFKYDPKKCATLGEFVPIWRAARLDYFIMDYPKERLLLAAGELEHTYPAMAESFRNAVSSGILEHQWNATARIDNGVLSLDLMTPPTEEVKSIALKMAAAFNLAYQRFHDLQKAEKQTKEAQIELSLERVRARSLAMHTTSELQEVIHVVHQELLNLNIAISGGSFITINSEIKDELRCWGSGGTADTSAEVCIPLYEKPFCTNLINRIRKGPGFFTEEYSQEEKKEFFTFLFKHQPWSKLDAEQKKQTLCSPGGYTRSCSVSEYSSIFIINHFGEKFSATDNDTLQRFGKVFEQAYVRFLDLQKAEAQAKEAEIELALERVRARTMAMKHSDELAEASFLLDSQVRALGIKTRGCAFNIYGENESTEWFSSQMGTMPTYKTPREKLFLHYYEEGLTGKPIHIETFAGEACAAHYDYLCTLPVMGEALSKLKESGGSFPVQQTDHVVYFKYGYLLFITLEPVPEAHDIFIRFAKIFEQTYTRFLDLQKAEAQTREAQINLAVERVRARALSMFKSEEIIEVVAKLKEEVMALNIPDVIAATIFLKEGDDHVRMWDLSSLEKDNNGYQLPFDITFTLNKTDPFLYAKRVWENPKNYFLELQETKDFERYVAWLKENNKIEVAHEIEEYIEATQLKRLHHAVKKLNSGKIAIDLLNTPSDEMENILTKMGAAFDLAYTRFLDLQKAEAQALRAERDLIEIKAARKKAEDTLTELQSTQKQLIQSEKMASLGELTAGIAHEIQNPLNFVNNFSEVSKELLDEMRAAIEKGDTAEAKEIMHDVIQNLEKINHHGKRADAIVKGMLQHSRSSSAVKEPTDINKLADEYLRLAYHGLRAKDKSFNVTLKTDYDETIGNINIIPQDIGRVILNLITNAFYVVDEKKKSGLEGYEPTVTVSTKKINDKIEISVADNGNGIPLKVLDKIFQPFFTTKPTGQGTGLGLSLSYDIVKAHGGEFKVETKENEGTTFIIQLPTNYE